MTTFQITEDDKTYTFDLQGNVSEDGERIGLWNTDHDSNIVIFRTAETLPVDFDALGTPSVTLAVRWKFNQKNQLCIQGPDGSELINLHQVGNIPFYATRNAVLQVRPELNHVFGFKLRGEWDVSDTHDLSFTVGGETSVIDGFVQDTRSRFMYHFFDKENLVIGAILGFVGEWTSKVVDGAAMLDFRYRREDGTTDTFSLPRSITIAHGTNQLLYQYDKDDRTYQIQLLGFLEVNENFEISYTFDRQVARNGEEQVASTTFTLQTVYVNKDFTNALQLALKKDDGSPGMTLTLSGQMTAVLGSTQLSVGFAFSQQRQGDTVTTTVAFNGRLTWGDGQVQWSFERNAATTTISIMASHIRLGSATADARINLVTEGGQLKGVRALFGINF